jgi:hypothetical protein
MYVVRHKVAIHRRHGQLLDLSLGDQQSVKWIPMMPWQVT